MYQIGIVAHTSRAEAAHELMETVGAAYLSIDAGTLGCNKNHRKVWQWLADHPGDANWLVVLEDDSIPCNNFRDQLTAALTVAPTPIISLYLGTGHPRRLQPNLKTTITTAQTYDAHWILHPEILHAVALAIKTDLVPHMLNHLNTTRHHPAIDTAISNWANRYKHPVAYTAPSLINHQDGPTTTHPRRTNTRPRTAWWHGTRDTWRPSALNLGHYAKT